MHTFLIMKFKEKTEFLSSFQIVSYHSTAGRAIAQQIINDIMSAKAKYPLHVGDL
jgi:hypothetical protein